MVEATVVLGSRRTVFSVAVLFVVASLALPARLAQAALVQLDPNNSTDSVLLSDLLSGEVMGVVVGDKVFTNFFYSTVGLDMPDPSNVKVFGFQDLSDNFGVSFHGTFADNPGNGPSDACLRFTVGLLPEALQSLLQISDAHLFIEGTPVVAEESVFMIGETFEGKNESLLAYKSTMGQGGSKLSDWVDFAQPMTSLRVTKDIYAFAADDSILPVVTSVIDQSFSQQQMPEPAAMTLFGFGALALFTRRRRRRQWLSSG